MEWPISSSLAQRSFWVSKVSMTRRADLFQDFSVTWPAGSLLWVAHPLADVGCDPSSRHLHMWAGSISRLSPSCRFSALTATCLPLPGRVRVERGIILPGVLLPLLPHPAGRAGLRHLLLLQEQRSFRGLPGKPGPQGLHQTGAHL